ncbi:hypothetical protein JCM12298_19110 [Desulfothermus naphthae]
MYTFLERSIKTTKKFYYVVMFFILFFLFFWILPVYGFVLGVNADNWNHQTSSHAFESALKKMKIKFIVWHISPEEILSGKGLLEIISFCRRNHFSYLFNTELVNYVPNFPYFEHKDGTYRWDISSKVMSILARDPLFLGVVYDEPMLMQSLNGAKLNNRTVLPYFVDVAKKSAMVAHDLVVDKIRELVEYYKSYGKRLVFEMVFPAYAHPAARGGAILAPKLLKENYNDLMYYVYSGAARQYGQAELWACVDLWFLDKFPFGGKYLKGCHSPEELLDTLKYAYTKGFDYVYIEHMKGLVDKKFNLSPYGKKVVEFQNLKSKLLQGNWRTIDANVIIKRFPDGYWGQKYSTFIPDHPYGSWQKRPEKMVEASLKWLKLLHSLSNGNIPEDANNWNAITNSYFKNNSYKTIAGLKPFILLDHTGIIPKKTDRIKIIDLTDF